MNRGKDTEARERKTGSMLILATLHELIEDIEALHSRAIDLQGAVKYYMAPKTLNKKIKFKKRS